MSTITTTSELEALYGAPVETSLVKEANRITSHYRTMIEASPFVALATSGPEGLDCSPRGDMAGFVGNDPDCLAWRAQPAGLAGHHVT